MKKINDYIFGGLGLASLVGMISGLVFVCPLVFSVSFLFLLFVWPVVGCLILAWK